MGHLSSLHFFVGGYLFWEASRRGVFFGANFPRGTCGSLCSRFVNQCLFSEPNFGKNADSTIFLPKLPKILPKFPLISRGQNKKRKMASIWCPRVSFVTQTLLRLKKGGGKITFRRVKESARGDFQRCALVLKATEGSKNVI